MCSVFQLINHVFKIRQKIGLLQAKADRVIYLVLEETPLYGEDWNPVYHESLSPHPGTASYVTTTDNVSFCMFDLNLEMYLEVAKE